MTTSKLKTGPRRGSDFSRSERVKIIEEYLSSGCTKGQIWEKYTSQRTESGQLLRWMRELGYDNSKKSRKFESNTKAMGKPKHQALNENIRLNERIKELEKALVNSELKAQLFETMVDIAEKEFKINLRKKSNTKPFTP